MRLQDNILLEILDGSFIASNGKNIISSCPFCGKEKHFGVRLEENHRFNCFKCRESGTIYRLLESLDRLDLFSGRDFQKTTNLLPTLNIYGEKKKEELPDKQMPLGYRRVHQDRYLESRGWTERDFEYFQVGRTKLSRKHKEYCLFPIIHHGFIKGFLGRNTQPESKKYRYRNSDDTEFGFLLYNSNNITTNTVTVILVEGIFDVQNITKLLNIYDDETVVVCATFGKKISPDQISIIKQNFSVTNIILLYDNDAIEESKEYSFLLSYDFKVEVGYFPNEKDGGEVNLTELLEILSNLTPPIEFKTSKVLLRL